MRQELPKTTSATHHVLLMSDIHANLSALDAVWHNASNFAPIHETWVLGDSVGYGPQPNEVVEYIRHLPRLTMVKGNHEAAALGDISTRNFNPVAAEATEWTKDNLSESTRIFLSETPLVAEKRNVTLCHGSPRDPLWEYVSTVQIAHTVLEPLTTSGCAVGHLHVPLVIAFEGSRPVIGQAAEDGLTAELLYRRWLINPGSVGQPRDGDNRASYAILRFDEDQDSPPTVSFHRVEYDIEATQRMIEDVGLPPYLSYRLAEGR